MSDDTFEFKRGALLLEFPCDGSPSSTRWIRFYEGSTPNVVLIRNEVLSDDDEWKATRSELRLERRELVQTGKALIELGKRLSSREAKRERKERVE